MMCGLEWLFGGSKKTEIPQMVSAAPFLQQAQYVPFGADRTRLMKGLEGMYDTSRNQYTSMANTIPGQISDMGNQLNDISGQVGASANQLTQMSGYNPYMNYYANPAATYQQDLAARQAALENAYSNYGSLGGQFQQQSGLMSANAASRGIGNSGYARRMQEDLAARKAAALGEAQNKAISDSNQYVLQAGNLYNQGRGLSQQAAGQAGALQAQRADMATKVPQMSLQAAQLYGQNALGAGEMWGKGQSEERSARQAISDYNTQAYNKAQGDWIQSYNNRNIQQASLDANRQTPGLLPTLMNAASTFLPLWGGRD